MGDSPFPWLAANVFDSASGARPSWVVPYRMVEVGGSRIAVVGYLTPDTKASQAAERTRGLRFGAGELGLHDALGEVRRAKPALTIVLAHAEDGELARLAEELRGSGVDLVVGGKGAQAVDTRIGGISVVSGAGGRSLAVADLVKTAGGGFEVRGRIVAGRFGRRRARHAARRRRSTPSRAGATASPAGPRPSSSDRSPATARSTRSEGWSPRRGATSRARTSASCGTRRCAPTCPPGR